MIGSKFFTETMDLLGILLKDAMSEINEAYVKSSEGLTIPITLYVGPGKSGKMSVRAKIKFTTEKFENEVSREYMESQEVFKFVKGGEKK